MTAVVLPFRRRAKMHSRVRALSELTFGTKHRVPAGETGRVTGLLVETGDLGVQWDGLLYGIVCWVSPNAVEVLS